MFLLTDEDRERVEKIVQQLTELQKEYLRIFFHKHSRREIILEKIAASYLLISELALSKEISVEEIEEQIRSMSANREEKQISKAMPFLRIVD